MKLWRTIAKQINKYDRKFRYKDTKQEIHPKVFMKV